MLEKGGRICVFGVLCCQLFIQKKSRRNKQAATTNLKCCKKQIYQTEYSQQWENHKFIATT